MTQDLSQTHEPLTDLFPRISNADTAPFSLTPDQIDFFHRNGYLAGVRLLNDDQIAVLREQLYQLIDPNHPGHGLFYEFHSNESSDPATILFHALGAWRIAPAFTICCGILLFWCRPHNCSAARFASGTTNCSANLRTTAESSRGIRTIPTGPAPSRWPTCRAGLASMIRRAITDVFITCQVVIVGTCCQLPDWRTTWMPFDLC